MRVVHDDILDLERQFVIRSPNPVTGSPTPDGGADPRSDADER